MKTMYAALVAATLFSGVASAQELVAQEPRPVIPEVRLKCFAELSRFTWNPQSDRPGVDSGDKFREGLAKCDDLLAIANSRSAMFEVHDKEAKVFARAKRFVIAAYAVLWGVLILFVAMIFFRQRKFNRAIADLEAKLKRAEGGAGAGG